MHVPRETAAPHGHGRLHSYYSASGGGGDGAC